METDGRVPLSSWLAVVIAGVLGDFSAQLFDGISGEILRIGIRREGPQYLDVTLM